MKRRQFMPEKIIGLLRQAEVEMAQGTGVSLMSRILKRFLPAFRNSLDQ
jgi:hypothetical protein